MHKPVVLFSLVLLFTLGAPLFARALSDPPGNLVPTARVSASTWELDHPPRLAADQQFDTWWACAQNSQNAWLEFSWDEPVAISEFVVKLLASRQNFLQAKLLDGSGAGIFIESDGSQHLRTTVQPDRICVQVSDWFGGTSSSAGEWTTNYGQGKPLHTGDKIQGLVRLHLLPGPMVSVQTKPIKNENR